MQFDALGPLPSEHSQTRCGPSTIEAEPQHVGSTLIPVNSYVLNRDIYDMYAEYAMSCSTRKAACLPTTFSTRMSDVGWYC